MSGYSKQVLEPHQTVRFKTMERFLSYFGTEPRRLNAPIPTYLLISIKTGEGFCYIDNNYVALRSGTLLLVSPYSFLHLVDTSFLLGSVIIFTEAFFCITRFHENLLYKVTYDPRSRPFVQLAETTEKAAFINANIKMFGMEYQFNKELSSGNERLINAVSSIMLIIHARQLANMNGSYDPYNDEGKSMLVAFIRLVNFHYKEETALAYYAKQLHITISHLQHTCKKGYGWTPKAIIQTKLLNEAKRLLTFDPRSIDAIGDELGFADNSAFINFFRQNLNQSPQAYREGNAPDNFNR
jgi:AraC family transcriptional activator of pobA